MYYPNIHKRQNTLSIKENILWIFSNLSIYTINFTKRFDTLGDQET